MIRHTLLISLIICHTLYVNAQSSFIVLGIIKDTTGQAIVGGNILITCKSDTSYGVSDEQGLYQISGLKCNDFTIKVSILGYNPFSKHFVLDNKSDTIKIPDIVLKVKYNTLHEVVIKGKSSPITLKEDTIEYKIDQYKLREHSVVEDLLKRLPGLKVDRDGNITFMGKPISKIKINGQEFDISDIRILTQLLPTDMLEKVQIIDDYGDMARITGRKTSSPIPVINLQTKTNIDKTYQLQATLAKGTDGIYNASIINGISSPKGQIFLVGKSTNTPQNTGKRTIHNGVLHATTRLKKLVLRSSINWENESGNYESGSIVTTSTNEGSLIQNNYTLNNKRSNTNSFYLSGDYKSKRNDIANFMARGSLSNQSTTTHITSNQTGIQYLNTYTDNFSKINLPTFEGNGMLSHPFKHTGRVITTNMYINYSKDDNKFDNNNHLLYYNNNGNQVDSFYHQQVCKAFINFNTLLSTSYIEPIDKKSNIEIKYELNTANNSNLLETYQIDNDKVKTIIDSLSTQYRFNKYKNLIGLTYLHKGNKIEWLAGANGTFYQLTNHSYPDKIKNTGHLISPVGRIAVKIGRADNLSMVYHTDINLPTYQQIQPVKDRSNVLFPVVGNPHLKAANTNTFSMEYRHAKQSIIFVSLTAALTNNKIATNTLLLPDSFNTIIQETHFLNADGEINLTANYGWSKQMFENKLQVSAEGNFGINNNILYMENEKKIAKNLSIQQSFKSSLFQKWCDLNSEITYAFNRNAYIIQENKITNISSWNFYIEGKLYFLKSWAMSFNAFKQLNKGLNSNSLANPTIINAGIEKSFIEKKLICKIQGINLANEVSNVSQVISGNVITQTKTNMVGTYFLMSIIYDFKRLTSR